jgi:pimeloyl-ACP methyl ester carboxylesterase
LCLPSWKRDSSARAFSGKAARLWNRLNRATGSPTRRAGWNAVSTELQGQGFTVLTAPNFLCGITTDAPYVASFLAQRTNGTVVLVGHSDGGFVITNAALAGGDVKALVYVDAFMPDEGETTFGVLGDSGSRWPYPTRPPSWTSSDTRGRRGGRRRLLKPDAVYTAFVQDLPEADRSIWPSMSPRSNEASERR